MVGTEQGNERLGRGAGGDISRRIDVVAEAVVMEIVKKHDFNPTIIAEESGRIEVKDDGFFVIDAINTEKLIRVVQYHSIAACSCLCNKF